MYLLIVTYIEIFFHTKFILNTRILRTLAVEQDLALEKAISIEGTLLMMDDATPHVAVPVQAMSDGEVIATTLGDKSGKYQFISLKPGRYQVRCHVLGEYVYYGEGGSTVTDESRAVFLQAKGGITRDNIDFRFPPFKKGTWKTFDVLDGLPYNTVKDIYHAPDGVMWFGIWSGGVFRYSGIQIWCGFSFCRGTARRASTKPHGYWFFPKTAKV